MKSAPPSEAARELKSITASFAKVRVLHYVSKTPTTAATIAERLDRHGGAAYPSQILANFVRRGLIRSKATPADSGRQYSLTPKGRRMLAAAKRYLRLGSERRAVAVHL